MYFLIFLQVITVNLFSKYNIQEIKIIQTNKKIISLNNKNKITKLLILPENTLISINKKIKRYFSGKIIIKRKGDRFLIFQELELNNYVLAVLKSELDKDIPKEALKAFYLVVKNYSITHLKRHKKIKADFCDIAHCQLYYGNTTAPQPPKGGVISHPTEHGFSNPPKRGIYQTVNLDQLFDKKIYYKNKLAITPYSSSCGEYTCDSETIWNKAYPYLKGKKLKFNLDKWSYKLSKKDLIRVVGIDLVNKLIIKDGCVKNGENFRRKINLEFGWNKVKSNVFTIKKYKNYYLIKGSGFGHNVGFCIKEAIELAKEGKNYIEILNYFFDGIEVR